MNKAFIKYWTKDGTIPDGDCGRKDSLRAFEAGQPQWQPIESAPKDGTKILCYHPSLFAYNETWEEWQMVLVWDGDKWTDLDEGYEANHPTHWQPLPKPPCQ